MAKRFPFWEAPTRHLFFTGKGGVGKTSIACATAVALADSGRRILLVSTDPASNLTDVLGTRISAHEVEVAGVPGLTAYDLDPIAAAAAYRERIVGPYRGLLPAASLASIEEQLSGACTVEIAAFDEFSRILGDPQATSRFDHVVFDTAPTGHTLRLLTLPAAWAGFLETNTTGTSCLGPLAGLGEQRALYEATLAQLTDGERTTTVLVTRPEASAINEAARTSRELREIGLDNQHLAINGLFRASRPDDPLAWALQELGREAVAALPPELTVLPTTRFPLAAYAPLGVEALRDFWREDRSPRHAFTCAAEDRAPAVPWAEQPTPCGGNLAGLVDEIAAEGKGVVMTMGKGGVGKTTVAAALAVALGERGHSVYLSTTDPAADLDSTLEDAPPGFTLCRIDPEAEVARYRDEVMGRLGPGLDGEGRKLVEEDLRSPCTEEIAVFRAFARAIDEGREGFVVLDTAPTGHTILLLDAALAYHRELGRQSGEVPPEVEELLPRLRDPNFTKVILVTLPETTPVNEAGQLAADLERAGIKPFAWVVNRSLRDIPVSDPLLVARQDLESGPLRQAAQLANRLALVPFQPAPPKGRRRLGRLTDGTRERQPASRGV